jgi:hypothetical protein
VVWVYGMCLKDETPQTDDGSDGGSHGGSLPQPAPNNGPGTVYPLHCLPRFQLCCLIQSRTHTNPMLYFFGSLYLVDKVGPFSVLLFGRSSVDWLVCHYCRCLFCVLLGPLESGTPLSYGCWLIRLLCQAGEQYEASCSAGEATSDCNGVHVVGQSAGCSFAPIGGSAAPIHSATHCARCSEGHRPT